MINHVDGRPIQDKPLVNVAMPNLFEDWSTGVIDGATWGTLVVGAATVSVAPSATTRGNNNVELATTVAGLQQAQMYSQDPWENGAGSFDATSGIINFTLEFELAFDVVADIEEASAFFGLSATQADTRASNNIIGVGVSGTDAISITDAAGAETTNILTGLVDDAWHHYRIQIWNSRVVFSVDHTIVQIHTTNLATTPMFLNFNYENDNASGNLAYLANISAGYQRYPEQILV